MPRVKQISKCIVELMNAKTHDNTKSLDLRLAWRQVDVLVLVETKK